MTFDRDINCKDCHWYRKENPYKILSNGKFQPCNNIGVDGWKEWFATQKEPERCIGFCKRGEYEPTGFWKDVAEIVHNVATEVRNETD